MWLYNLVRSYDDKDRSLSCRRNNEVNKLSVKARCHKKSTNTFQNWHTLADGVENLVFHLVTTLSHIFINNDSYIFDEWLCWFLVKIICKRAVHGMHKPNSSIEIRHNAFVTLLNASNLVSIARTKSIINMRKDFKIYMMGRQRPAQWQRS